MESRKALSLPTKPFKLDGGESADLLSTCVNNIYNSDLCRPPITSHTGTAKLRIAASFLLLPYFLFRDRNQSSRKYIDNMLFANLDANYRGHHLVLQHFEGN